MELEELPLVVELVIRSDSLLVLAGARVVVVVGRPLELEVLEPWQTGLEVEATEGLVQPPPWLTGRRP